MEKKKCPYCGSDDLYFDEERGELICRKCGAVVEEETIDYGRDWRIFEDTNLETVIRVGTPLSLKLPELGTNTVIGKSEDFGDISSDSRYLYKKLRKIQSTLVSKSERNIKPALAEINRIGSILNLPNVIIEEAARLYRKVAERNLIRGRAMESVIAAVIYIACRKSKYPITLKDLEEITGISAKDIGKTFRYLSKQLNIKVLPMDTEEYIYKLTSELKLPAKVLRLSLVLLSHLKKRGLLSGKGPNGVAAAIIYLVSFLVGKPIDLKELAKHVGVTEVTIKNRVKEIIEKLKLERQVKEALKKNPNLASSFIY